MDSLDYLVNIIEKDKDLQARIKSRLNIRSRSYSAIIALSVFGLLIAGIALLLAGLQYTEVYNYSTPKYVLSSQVMANSPYVFYLGGSVIPVQLTIPSDLSSYIGKTYQIWSTTAQPHTVVSTFASFDGSATTATFGGSIGDGFVFSVIAPNRMVITSATNVVFS